jgi:hypothetical protein
VHRNLFLLETQLQQAFQRLVRALRRGIHLD